MVLETTSPASRYARSFRRLRSPTLHPRLRRLRRRTGARRCRERSVDSVAVQSSAEAHVGRALGGHEPKPLAWPAAGQVNLRLPLSESRPNRSGRAFTRLLR